MLSAGNTAPLLELKGITKRFPGVLALSNVSFSVGQAEVVALIGENGAGKSTLMKTLGGVHGPYALWHHQHTFTPVEGGGVECFDRVIYRLPFGVLGRITHAAIVRRQLIEIFQFRRRVIGERLGWIRAIQEAPVVRPL